MILLMASFVALIPFHRADSAAPRRQRKRPLRCTKAALDALKPIPEFAYECEDHDEDSQKSPARRAALNDYRRELEETFNDAEWWATPVADLNACSITKAARTLNRSESGDFAFNIALYGEGSTRLVAVVDPCIKYSYQTLNAYVLQRAGGRVYATQVVDAFFTRFDAALDMSVAQLNGERLLIIERTYYGGGAFSMTTTAAAYTINPRTQRAAPKKIFRAKGKLTNEFEYDAPPFFDADQQMNEDKGWRSPFFVRDGRLARQFYVYSPTGRGHFRHDAYVWNGRYYAAAR
jgi:hypothetical protein